MPWKWNQVTTTTTTKCLLKMEIKVGIENLMGAMEENVKEISWKREKQRHKIKQCELKNSSSPER